MVFVPVRWLRVSVRRCFSVVVACVAWKNDSGVSYGGLAVPFVIVWRSKASSASRYFPSKMSCLGMQAWGFQIGIKESLDIRFHTDVTVTTLNVAVDYKNVFDCGSKQKVDFSMSYRCSCNSIQFFM